MVSTPFLSNFGSNEEAPDFVRGFLFCSISILVDWGWGIGTFNVFGMCELRDFGLDRVLGGVRAVGGTVWRVTATASPPLREG
jgi:hypothetical protein